MIDLISGDTIAAIATAAGIGGVGIVRVSGPRALAIVTDVIGLPLMLMEDRPLAYSRRVRSSSPPSAVTWMSVILSTSASNLCLEPELSKM